MQINQYCASAIIYIQLRILEKTPAQIGIKNLQGEHHGLLTRALHRQPFWTNVIKKDTK